MASDAMMQPCWCALGLRARRLLGLPRIVCRIKISHSDRADAAQLNYCVVVGPLVMVSILRKVEKTAGFQSVTPSRIEFVAHPEINGPSQNRQVIIVGVDVGRHLVASRE